LKFVKITMVHKMLFVFMIIIIGSITSSSIVYYSFFSRNLKIQANNQNRIAFEMIFDNFQKIKNETTPQIESFIKDLIENNLNIINIFHSNYDYENIEDYKLYNYLPGILFRYRPIMSLVNSFAPSLNIKKLLIYDKNGKTRIVYHSRLDQNQMGIYLNSGKNNSFILFGPQQLSQVAAQQIQFLSSKEIRKIFNTPLPENITDKYSGEIPKVSVSTIGSFGTDATIKFITPIFNSGKYLGISEIHIALNRSEIERYSRFSQTEINIFANNSLLMGTLAEYRTLPAIDKSTINYIDSIGFEIPPIIYSDITIEGNKYLQGSIAIGEINDNYIVITANFSKTIISQERNAMLLSILTIVFIFGFIALLTSIIIGARVNNFIQRMIKGLSNLARGVIPEKMNNNFRGELNEIKNNFNSLIINHSETVLLAKKIASGDLNVYVTERSKMDTLSQSLNRMTKNLQLTINNLAEAKVKADSASQAKSVFLANMSHELRTPLNAILGFSQLMKDDPYLLESHKKNLGIINSSGTHLLSLINDVLDISKIEAGHSHLAAEDFNLEYLVNNVIDMIRIRAESKGLLLHIDPKSDFPKFINGDAPKIRQIIINLLGNAVKFTKTGNVTLKIYVENRQNKIIVLHGEVKDTGSGIEQKDIKRIFLPFEQIIKPAIKEGTGLGLAISRQFAEQMNGGITVDSTPGIGTVFHFSLEVKAVKDKEEKHAVIADKNSKKIKPEIFSNLPIELLKTLNRAANALDIEQIQAIIKQIKTTDLILADILQNLIDTFDLETLQQLLHQTGRKK